MPRHHNRLHRDLDRAIHMVGMNKPESILMTVARELSYTLAMAEKREDALPFRLNVSRIAERWGVSRARLQDALAALIAGGLLLERGEALAIEKDYRRWRGKFALTARQVETADEAAREDFVSLLRAEAALGRGRRPRKTDGGTDGGAPQPCRNGHTNCARSGTPTVPNPAHQDCARSGTSDNRKVSQNGHTNCARSGTPPIYKERARSGEGEKEERSARADFARDGEQEPIGVEDVREMIRWRRRNNERPAG